MAKTKDRDQNEMFAGAPAKAAQMPEGYYSGDKPNPNLRAFVEAHVVERPYDPETDDYDVPAFDRPIDTTKATAIYNMHMYWSKKPHDAIRQYIRHYTKPGDLVLDPFCGSGSTALAALIDGRKAVAIDRSPAATFITKNYCTPLDVAAVEKDFRFVLQKVQSELAKLYETRCDRCGGRATTAHTVYSQVFECPRCLQKVPLFDCVEVPVLTSKGETSTANGCPHCHARGHDQAISATGKRFGAVPVAVSYICESGCKPARSERIHNDRGRKRREYFARYDLTKIEEIDRQEIPYWYPTTRMMNMAAGERVWGTLFRAGVASWETVDEVFTRRNLWALALLRDAIGSHPTLQFAFNACLLNASRMYRHRDAGGGGPAGSISIQQIHREMNVLSLFKSKVEDICRGAVWAPPEGTHAQLCVSTQSAQDLSAIPSASIDYIFTDPPYSSKFPYGELNFIWEAWLDVDTRWHADEIIVNSVQGKTEEDWATMMRKTIADCYRVLKPGRWLTLCYHDTAEGTWALVQDILAEAGFVVEDSRRALYIDANQKTIKQLTADKVNQRDLVINFRKPRPGEVRGGAAVIPADADDRTFRELAHALIRQYLETHPGSTKDRVYDALVSHMVRSGQMQAHDFEALLREVADEVREPLAKDFFTKEDPDIFGTHEVGRWYVKETETDSAVDAAESAREDHAGAIMEEFIADYLKKDREVDGVHYSDLFERYLFAVKDKPRRQLAEWLPDYFYKTPEGTWRLPETDEERAAKMEGRKSGTSRRIRRYATMLEQGVPIPPDKAPSAATLAEWIRHAKKAGLYETGKLLYERGGLDTSRLSDKEAAGVEEDYEVCVRALERGAAVPARRKQGRKKKGA